MSSLNMVIVGGMSLVIGFCFLMSSHALVSIIFRAVPHDAESWDKETQRRIDLREGSKLIRYFEPLVDEFAAFYRRDAIRGTLSPLTARLRQNMAQGGHSLPLTAEELLGLSSFQGLLFGGVVAFVLSDSIGWPLASLAAFVGVVLVMGAMLDKVNSNARRRMDSTNSRLPFAIDLMALTMAAGSTFPKSLSIAAKENRDHPLGHDLAAVSRHLACGKTQHEAIEEWRERSRCPEIDEVASAINNAEKLGAPMSETLLRLAETVRLARSQRIEAHVERVQAMMAFPSLLFVAACLLIVVAPFIIDMLRNPLFQ